MKDPDTPIAAIHHRVGRIDTEDNLELAAAIVRVGSSVKVDGVSVRTSVVVTRTGIRCVGVVVVGVRHLDIQQSLDSRGYRLRQCQSSHTTS